LLHAHELAAAALAAASPLALEDLLHAHELTPTTLQGIPVLTPEALEHAVVLTSAGIATESPLSLEDLVHLHTLGAVVVFSTDTFFLPTEGRIIRVAAERRIVLVRA
jgi:hypothetical protein